MLRDRVPSMLQDRIPSSLDEPFSLNRKRLVAILLVVILISAGTAAAVTLTALDFNPLEPGKGPLTDSVLVIDSEQIEYNGLNATGVTLDVNNTDTADHGGDVYVALKNASGAVVSSGSQTGLTFTGGTVTSVTVSVTSTNVTKFDTVEVRIEETS